jgi:hypothetical protein
LQRTSDDEEPKQQSFFKPSMKVLDAALTKVALANKPSKRRPLVDAARGGDEQGGSPPVARLRGRLAAGAAARERASFSEESQADGSLQGKAEEPPSDAESSSSESEAEASSAADDELEEERRVAEAFAAKRRAAALLNKKAAAAAAASSRRKRPPLSEERAASLIQAGVRGLIARRSVEVKRCRLDLRAALADAKVHPGEPHPEVIQTMIDLGEAYLHAWDRDSAEQAYSVALQSIEREYGCVVWGPLARARRI